MNAKKLGSKNLLWTHALAVVCLGALINVSTTLAQNPFAIDGNIPDCGTDCTPIQFSDPSGNSKELGPVNGTDTKLGVIQDAVPPMLDFTNPNGSTDIVNIWMQTATDANDDDWVYFAWERDSKSGSSVITFEFQQAQLSAACDYEGIDQVLPEDPEETTLIGSCNPWEGRGALDFLIVWDFKGGATDIIIRTFDGTMFDIGVNVSDSGDAFAVLNGDKTAGEAAVNLSQTVFPPDPVDCFSIGNIIPGTITGNSDEADYKDTVLADFTEFISISSCALELEKEADTVIECTETGFKDVVYTYTINNPEIVDLHVTIIDDNGTPGDESDDFDVIDCHAGVLPGDPNNDPDNPETVLLLAGTMQTFTCTLSTSGTVTNIATAEGGASLGTIGEVKDTAMATVQVEKCDISVTKVCQDDDDGEIGGTVITFTGTVTNDGSTILEDVTVVDDNATPNDPLDDVNLVLTLADGTVVTSLEPEQTAFFSGEHDIDLATYDAEEGSTNTVDASGTALKETSAEQKVTATANANCEIITNPTILVDKNCDRIRLVPDEDCGNKLVLLVEFSGTVTNNGDVGLTGVTVTDDKAAQSDIVVTTEPSGGGTVLDHINGFDLPFNTTVHFSGSYVATSTDTGTDDPTEATFSDTITAQGADAINTDQTASDSNDEPAKCELCPTP